MQTRMQWLQDMTYTDVFLFVLLLLGTILWVQQRCGLNLPPGPFWRLPVLGNLPEFTRHEDTRITLRKFREIYGEVYSLYLGTQLVVVVNGLNALRELLVNRGDEFSDRPNTFASECRAKGYGLINSSGHLWKTTRRFSLNTLRSFGFGKRSVEANIHEEIGALISEFEKQSGQPFDPRHHLMKSFCNVICFIEFGTSYSSDDPELQRILRLAERFSALSAQAGILNFMPMLRFLPGDLFMFKEFMHMDKEIKDFFDKKIAERKETYDENNTDDFISACLKEMENSSSTKGEQIFTEFHLNILITDIMGAGAETSAFTTRWALLYLVGYPEIQERIAKEIAEHVGEDRLPCIADKENLVYTEAFIMETQRMGNLLIISVPRTTSRDRSFRGYTIPKGTVILPDFDSVLSSPQLWENPDRFMPERFIGSDGKTFKPDGFIPFSAGRRNCIGEQLARMELFLFIAALVQKFKFLPPTDEQLDIKQLDGIFGVTHAPKPFKIRAVQRF